MLSIHYLNKDYEKLLCVDIVCHGVPSNRLWQDYRIWVESIKGSSVCSVDFRNKMKFGWNAHIETLYFENNKFIDSEVYKNLFYGHNALRPSCYKCPYKSIFHPGDITIADYWGINIAAPGFNDNKGVSLVLINTDVGAECFDRVKDELIYLSTDIKKSLQPPLVSPFPEPDERKTFWKEYNDNGFAYIAKHYGGYSAIKEKIGYAKRLIKQRMGKEL